jgi:hypothetical protein
MALVHPELRFYVGDTWEIEADLHYADGSPFNLGAGAAVTWQMSDANGNVIFSLSLGAGVTVADTADNPPYQVAIAVPGANAAQPLTGNYPTTAAVLPGRYSDRIIAVDPSGYRSTQCVGVIDVKA